jgi:hypothetical protein
MPVNPYCPVSSVDTGRTAFSSRMIASQTRTIAAAAPNGVSPLAGDASIASLPDVFGNSMMAQPWLRADKLLKLYAA